MRNACGRAVTGQREREREICTCMQLSLPLSHSLSHSLTGEQRAHTLFTGQREREREEEREKEGVREKGGVREERERERGRERELLFLFLKRMTGALAPCSYLVFYSFSELPSISSSSNQAKWAVT